MICILLDAVIGSVDVEALMEAERVSLDHRIFF